MSRARDLLEDDACMSPDPLQDEWARQMKGLALASPLDEKARDLAVAYFDIDGRTITKAAQTLVMDRQTVTRRLERAHRKGWVILGDAPIPARDATLPRVCGRRVFWADSRTPEWDGDTSRPLF
jgi:hypothetical protein